MSRSDTLVVWSREGGMLHLGARCAVCGGLGRMFVESVESDNCEHCDGCGWFGINPERPVMADPGSVERIAMLGVRYASGVPLWNAGDRPIDERTFRWFERHVEQSVAEVNARNGQGTPAAEYGGLSLAP